MTALDWIARKLGLRGTQMWCDEEEEAYFPRLLVDPDSGWTYCEPCLSFVRLRLGRLEVHNMKFSEDKFDKLKLILKMKFEENIEAAGGRRLILRSIDSDYEDILTHLKA